MVKDGCTTIASWKPCGKGLSDRRNCVPGPDINAANVVGMLGRIRPTQQSFQREVSVAQSVKKTKRVRIEGTDTRFEIRYVVESVVVQVDQVGPGSRTGARGWIDPDGMNVEEIGNGRFKRTSDGAYLITDE
jgi:hypothetical protein